VFEKCSHELYKASSMNPITNPNPVYSHTHTRILIQPLKIAATSQLASKLDGAMENHS
jgi:hypothetical protein